MANVRWLGVAGLEFTSGRDILLVDPYISRPSKWQTLFRPLEPEDRNVRRYLGSLPGAVRGILIGHTHSDHVLDVPVILNETDAAAYGTRSLANLLSAYGLEERAAVIQCGTTYEIGPFRATPIRSRHGRAVLGRVPFPGEIERDLQPPLRVNRYRHGGPLNWRIEAEGMRCLHIGSADFMDEEMDGLEVDVLFVCAAGRQSTPNFTERLFSLIAPRVVVPFHFDDFSARGKPGARLKHLPGVKLSRFVREIEAATSGTRVVVPEYMAPLDL